MPRAVASFLSTPLIWFAEMTSPVDRGNTSSQLASTRWRWVFNAASASQVSGSSRIFSFFVEVKPLSWL